VAVVANEPAAVIALMKK